MTQVLARYWWVPLVRGIFAIIFGILLFIVPAPISIATLIYIFAAYAIMDGIFAVINGISDRKTNRAWWAHALEGVVGIIAGILAFLMPGITAVVLLYILAAWAIITGVFEIIAAIHYRREIEGEFWLGLGGLLSIIFGVMLLIMNPLEGILTILWLVAVFSIAFGIVMIMLAFRLRGLGSGSTTNPPARTTA